MQPTFALRTLSLVLATLGSTSLSAQESPLPRTVTASVLAQAAAAGESEVRELQEIVVDGERSDDEKGADDVFHKNVSNVYLGKEELERYRVDAAGDILKGLNGVYNMNTRTAGGAITPNIRGVSGKGRIPVTIDGTEQTVDVWLNNYGVGDRNYVDPALFRSIAVDKSPDLSRGMKPGVGGSIAIRTIEPDDIIPAGRNWGFQLKTEASNNAVRPQNSLEKYLGQPDYRRVGGTADGAGGGYQNGEMSPYALIIDDVLPPRNKGDAGHTRFGGDKSVMLSGAFKAAMTDGLVAYSYRDKGNYYAGKRGASAYQGNPIYQMDDCGIRCESSAAFVPNMAEMYRPGDEVLNSNTRTETWLLKNNWHLANNQKISLQYMQNDITFGEINPFQTNWALNFYELNPFYDDQPKPAQTQNLNSHIKTQTYKLGYELKPDDNRWVDLEASLWSVRTNSVRHQSGGMSLAVNSPDPMHDAWYWCNVRNSTPWNSYGQSCEDLGAMWGFDRNTTRDEIIAKSNELLGSEDKQIISGARQRTDVTRHGANISNRFRMADNFSLTVAADVQQEKLAEQNTIINGQDLFNMYGTVTGLAKLAGPRSGKRQEWGMSMAANWQPTSRLSIQAGLRYHRFWARDVALGEERRKRNQQFAWGSGFDTYMSGVVLPYLELASDAEIASAKSVQQEYVDRDIANKCQDVSGGAGVGCQDPDFLAYYAKAVEHYQTFGHSYQLRGYDEHGNAVFGDQAKAYYRVAYDSVSFRDGKLDATETEIRKGMFDERVDNPQAGATGSYYKYLIPHQVGGSAGYDEPGGGKDHVHEIDRLITGYPDASTYFRPCNFGATGDWQDCPNAGTLPGVDALAYQQAITDAQKWAEPEKMTGHGWAPMLAVTYAVADNQRVFARYAEMTRFPSLYEATSSSIDGLIGVPTTPGLNLKPERSRNWEVGYAFDFSSYLKNLAYGDVRLTYFSNTIHNAIDTTEVRRITQYDRKITNGLELQSRIDTGSFFASFGATYRLKNVTCDADTAFMFDLYQRRVPDCIEGGFGVTRFNQSLQPKYSINFELGTRLMNQRMELGLRGIFHGKVDTKQYDAMLAQGLHNVFTFTGKPYHWKPALLLDLYGRFAINERLSMNLGVTNLTNRYYLDPLSNVPTPGPGRTVTVGMQARF